MRRRKSHLETLRKVFGYLSHPLGYTNLMKQQYVLLGIFTVLFLAYQNFGALTAEDLHTLQTMKEFSALEQEEPPLLRAPKKGRDLASVSSGWAEDQSKVLLDGADERMVESLNEKINRWFRSESEHDNLETNETPDSAGTRLFGKKKVRFVRINSMELILETNSLLSCSIEPKGAHVDYSKNWSQNTSLGIGLRSENTQTQFIFRHNF